VNATAYTVNTSVLRQTTGDNTNGVRGFIDTAAYFAGFTNGTMITSNTTAVTFQPGYNQSFVMGQWNVGWLNGYIYEILIYNRALSLGEYQSVEGYLSQKWGFSPAKVFTPLSVPGCQLWLDGADPATINGNVTSVREKANNVTFTATGTVTRSTIGATQSLNFAGAGYLSGTVNNLLVGTSFVVFRTTAANNGYYPFFTWRDNVVNSGLANFPAFGYLPGGNLIGPYTTWVGAGTPTTSVSIGNSYITSYSWSGTTTNVGFNGAIPTTGTQSAYAHSETLLWIAFDNGYYTTANIGEILIYNTILSAAQRQAVEGYLAWKWNLQGSLALAHPNYLTTGNFVRSLTLATTHPYYSLPPATRAFTPLDIPGCALWLDGADQRSVTFSSGSNVSQWNDKSGNGLNATVLNGTPTYTQALGMTFNGSSALQVNYTASPTIETLFVIIKFNSVSAQGDIFSGTAMGQREYLLYSPYSPGTIYLGRYGNAPSGSINGGTVITSSNYMLGYVFNGTANTISLYQGGNLTSSGTPQFTYSSGGTISAIGSYNGGGYLQGQIYELIVYNTALGAAQRQAVEGYLANKWGLKASIPVFANPTSIPSCAMWLDGADSTTMFQNTAGTTPITADGQTIAAWRDKSANGYLFIQPTTANQPVYKTGIRNGSSITRWNGTSTGLQSSTTLPFYTSASSGGSFFFVFMVTSNNTQRFLMTYQNQTSGTFCVSESEIGCPTGNSDAGNFGIHQGCGKANVALNQITTNTYVMMNLNLLSSGTAPANTTIFKNGTSAAMTAQNGGFYSGTTYPSANNARNLNIGYRVPVGAFSIDCWLAGDIAEIVWYQTPLSSAQQQQVEGYLAWKWGLQASLPATHPFYATVPVPHPFNKVPPTIRQPVLYYDVAPGNWAQDWQPYLRALTRANAGATQNIGSITGGGTYTSYGWFGNVLAPNGNIYFVPYGSSNILVLNTNTGVTTNITGGATFTTFNQYRGGVLASNGNIYCVPFASTNILVINPNTGVTSNMTGSATFTSFGWHGGVLGPDGNIYCAPANALNILVIRPATGTTSNLTGGATYPGAGAWAGGVLAPNGNIYFAPNAATNILVLNTMTGVTSNLTGGATYSGSWTGGVLATNGNIYFCPYTASNVLVLNPATGVTSNLVGGASYPGGGAWAGGVLAPNGKIYFPPSGGATNILVVDPIAGTTSTLTSGVIGSSAWQGGVLAPNGTIYFAPLIATTILTVSFTGLLQTPSLNYCMSAYTNKL
jgi:hypothetical protein